MPSLPAGLVEPTYDMSTRVRGMARAETTIGAARRLKISRDAVMRIAAGLPIRPGTRALVEQSLARDTDANASKGHEPDEASTTNEVRPPDGSSQ